MKKTPISLCFGQNLAKKISLTLKLSLLLTAFCSLLITSNVYAQQTRVTGRVVESTTGEGLPGVTVQVKGTNTGGITQADGTYSVNLTPGATTLVFSFVGFATQEIEIAGRTVIDVIMNEEVTVLDDIIVTGYSVERKKDIIGSVAVVNTDDMQSMAASNALVQMQGRVSGVSITSDGSMDGGTKMRVRGFGSFAGSDPLYIIDGVPGDIDRLNPNDIQSVQVLKDAASSSIYGARAANGVVIITTRQGQAGANRVSVDYYYGVNIADKRNSPEMCSVEELGELLWLQMEGAGRQYGDANWSHPIYGNGPEPVIPEYLMVNQSGKKYSGAALEGLKVSDPALFASLVDPANYDIATHQIVQAAYPNESDWWDITFNPAPVQNLQLSISGGSERGTYMLGLGYNNTKSISNEWAGSSRVTLRANTSFKIQNWLRVGENLQVRYAPGFGGGEGSWNVWSMAAIVPAWDIGGFPASSAIPGVVSTGAGSSEISSKWRARFNKSYTYGIFGNVFVEMTPFRGLVIRSSFGGDINYRRSQSMNQVTYEHAENRTPPNSISYNFSDDQGWTFTNQITYDKTLGSHTFKIVVGTEANYNTNSSIGGSREDLYFDSEPDFMTLNAATGTQSNSGTFSENALWSQFGRLDYSYADKYMGYVVVRRDGSSKFSEKYRYGYFPAAAIGWRISQEDFMSGLTWLTDLKLRASWGIIGNQSGLSNENQYTLYQQANNQSYSIQGGNATFARSFTPSRQGDSEARWEKAISTNIGFDASFFGGGTSLSFDWFIRTTEDLLVQRQPPYTSPNVTQPMINVGTIENKGVDITVGQRGRVAGQLEYDASLNFSAYKNNVLKVMDNPLASLSGGGTRMGNTTLTKMGYPISYFYGYLTDGFINNQAELDEYTANVNNTIIAPAIGKWKLKDVNDDGTINDLDRTYMGSPHPKFQMGLNLSLAYKGFDLSGFLFFNYGNKLFNWNRYNVDFNTFAFNRSKRMLEESWTPERGNSALLPKYDINDIQSNKYPTDYFIEDGTYLRFKQLQIGYALPTSIISKMKLQKLRVYVQGQNLFTWTKSTALDVGLNTSGSDLGMGVTGNPTPTPVQFLFGVNLAF